MVKISPDEILKKHGQWIEREKFIELVAQARNVGHRQAWNIIRKESSSHVLRRVLDNRRTIYGLAEFGPPPAQQEKILVSGPTHFGLLGGFVKAWDDRAERKAGEKDEQSRKRRFEIALGWQTIWLNHQDLSDEKYQSELEAVTSRLLAEYGLTHR